MKQHENSLNVTPMDGADYSRKLCVKNKNRASRRASGRMCVANEKRVLSCATFENPGRRACGSADVSIVYCQHTDVGRWNGNVLAADASEVFTMAEDE